MATTWGERVKPETSWGVRGEVETDRSWRIRPITYKTPLEDAYRIVHDEDDKIIYILANSWKLIPATFWGTRPKVD